MIRERVLGEKLPNADYVTIEIFTQREGITNNLTLRMDVRIDPSLLPRNRKWKGKLNFASMTTFSEKSFNTATQADVEERILHSFVGLSSKLAPSLFELDPRIGWLLPKPIPSSPLFDPPERERHPTVVPRIYKKILEWSTTNRLSVSAYPGQINAPPCPFCGKGVIGDAETEAVLWGGGNLGWIHDRCGSWILEEP